jgi:rSAM/selenodomain-associated transferase 1
VTHGSRALLALAEPFVALFIRFPTPGEAKTRLIPAFGAQGAARLHRQLVERTVATVRATGLQLELWTTGAEASAFRHWLGADIAVVEQGAGDLGERMARAAARAPVILLGADVPDLAPADLTAAVSALHSVPVALGPAEDGGYYLLALADPCPFLFTGIKWGSASVLQSTLDRLSRHGQRFSLLRTLADLDRPEDLVRWPWLHPC